MRNLIVEITSKEGVRIERITLDDNGLSIGRAWNSDIIVQDKFVDSDHLGLSLDQDQQVLVSDFSTTNGSWLAGKKMLGIAKPYGFGDVLTIGDTRIKVFDANAPVAPTSLRSKWFLLIERFSSIKALVVLTVLALFVQASKTYSTSFAPLKIEKFLASAFGILMLLLLWSLVLGFVAKLLRGETKFKEFWVLGCLSVIVANLLAFFLLIVRFNLQDVNLGEAIAVTTFCAFAIFLAAGVFSFTTHLQNRNKWLCSFLIVLSLYGIIKSDDYLREPHQMWKPSTETEQATLPPAFLIRQGVSTDEYLEQTDSLFDFE